MAVSATRLIRPYKADTATMYCIVATFLLVLGWGFKHMVKVNVSTSSAERSGNNAVHSSWLIQPKRLIQPYKADTAKKADTAVQSCYS